jgi:hypothetical protein
MSKGLLITLGVVGVLLLALLMVFGSYVSAKNQMVAKDEVVKAAWSDVDVQLQRRADLIPNLVETVKGFTKEESTVFGDIANARAGMLNAQGPAGQDCRPMGSWIRRWAACCCSPKTTRNCAPATNSCACRTNLPEPKIASVFRAGGITIPCATTTPSCANSPIASGPGIAGFQREQRLLRGQPERAHGAGSEVLRSCLTSPVHVKGTGFSPFSRSGIRFRL